MGMELIDDTAGGVQAIVGTIVRGEGFHHAALHLVDDGVPVGVQVVLQVGVLDDFNGIGEADLRLVLDGGGRIHLRPSLTVSKEHVQADASRESRLAILTGNLHIHIPESASAIGILPAEDVPEDEVLPRLQHKPLPGPFTLGVLKSLDKTDGPHRCLAVKVPSLVQRISEVIVVALNRQLYQLAGQDPFVPDVLCILLCLC